MMRFVLDYRARVALSQGCCFVLKKEYSVVAIALLTPPHKKVNHKLPERSEKLYFLPKMFRGEIPRALYGEGEKRNKALEDFINKEHMSIKDPHWYISAFGVDTRARNKGYGREMMEFLTTLGDSTNHKMYEHARVSARVRRRGY